MANDPKFADVVFNRAQAEEWLFKKISALPIFGQRLSAEYFLSGTTWEMRRERVREYIKAHDLQACKIGKNSDGNPEIVEQVFLRMYGEFVNQKPKKETRK